MSVRRFKADINSAAAKVQQGEILGIAAVSQGDSDGEVVITYHHADLLHPFRVQALAEDVSEYPDGNNFMLFTDSDDPPPDIMKAMEQAQEYLLGIRVDEMVNVVSKFLGSALASSAGTSAPYENDDDGDVIVTDYDGASSSDGGSEGGDDDFIGQDDEYFGLALSPETHHQEVAATGKSHFVLSSMDQRLLPIIKNDLRVVKQAGYRVGVFNGLGSSAINGIVCVSIRVNKLDLSEDALMAWNVSETDYVVLLIRYGTRYHPLDRILDLPAMHSGIQLRIGLCSSYKPTLFEATNAFGDRDQVPARPAHHDEAHGAFRNMFISASLNEFMNESLISLVKLRLSQSVSWDHANELLLQSSSLGIGGNASLDYESIPFKETAESSAAAQAGFHHVLGPDHLMEDVTQGHSFPLIAMQFAMRYFARCTQYCLRCHRKLEEGFEALRPYVCSNPLCLFQYMAMGFGPNVEHEILTEPSVVDLLVSLCYSSLTPSANRWQSSFQTTTTTTTQYPIREFPVGLQLRVPNMFDGPLANGQFGQSMPITAKSDKISGLILDDPDSLKRLTSNQWVIVRRLEQTPSSKPQGTNRQLHILTWDAIIQDVFAHKNRIEVRIKGRCDMSGESVECDPLKSSSVEILPYDVDFDTLTDGQKSTAMRHLLNTLPSIPDIRDYLKRHPNKGLRSCSIVSSDAATLLRWIVSSNRSCIHEVGTLDDPDLSSARENKSKDKRWTVKGKRQKEYIPGMDGYIQFRFSQGSPDKELRFNKALQEVARRKNISKYPTLFAWHGSDVSNWHSILRTGLDSKDIRCGRAFGNGVYFSPHFGTSTGYAMISSAPAWPNSSIKVQSVLSLNEIINIPEEFVSKNPHYVVSNTDWHQCRYLFVSSASSRPSYPHTVPQFSIPHNPILPTGLQSNAPLQAGTQLQDDGQGWAEVQSDVVALLAQDPLYEARGPDGQTLQIPVASMPVRTDNVGQGGMLTMPSNVIRILDEESDEESAEDQELLADDGTMPDEKVALGRNGKRPRPSSSMETILAPDNAGNAPPTPIPEQSRTGFIPGSLDLSRVPRLHPPSWATPAASRSLGRELKRMQQVQATTPLSELGWYVDFDAISNMFQWIVELHSFDTSLPLASDMRDANVSSIVTEVRFGKDWPMTPPFIRIIRPRFLPFINGGGGHVTAGGAMCMELLTNTGWSPANSMESVILQVRMALCAVDDRPARLDRTPRGWRSTDYGIDEAVDAYLRAAQAHGWAVPSDFQDTAYGQTVSPIR